MDLGAVRVRVRVRVRLCAAGLIAPYVRWPSKVPHENRGDAVDSELATTPLTVRQTCQKSAASGLELEVARVLQTIFGQLHARFARAHFESAPCVWFLCGLLRVNFLHL